nr:uncharacterized protein LOC123756652 [Procambarus clarkii]
MALIFLIMILIFVVLFVCITSLPLILMAPYTPVFLAIDLAGIVMSDMAPVLAGIIFWWRSRALVTLLRSLEDLMLLEGFQLMTGSYLFKMFIILLSPFSDFIMKTVWYGNIFKKTSSHPVLKLSMAYGIPVMPLVLSFPLVLCVTAEHVLRNAFICTNGSLERLLSCQAGMEDHPTTRITGQGIMKDHLTTRITRQAGMEETPASLLDSTCKLRHTYMRLHRIHQEFSSALSVLLFLSSLERLVLLTLMIIYMIAYPQSIATVHEYVAIYIRAMSIVAIFYLQGYTADLLQKEAATPGRIVLYVEAIKRNNRDQLEIKAEAS